MELLKAYLDYTIFGVLAFMSIVVVWFAVERWLYYRRFDIARFSQKEELSIALTRNLTTISTIGSNAPYVGLLGTVLGIMIAFYDISQGDGIEPQVIMVGLAMALKATAAGLLVAIPAIMFYNGLLRQVEVLTMRWDRDHAG